jgi:hypothetical protein
MPQGAVAMALVENLRSVRLDPNGAAMHQIDDVGRADLQVRSNLRVCVIQHMHFFEARCGEWLVAVHASKPDPLSVSEVESSRYSHCSLSCRSRRETSAISTRANASNMAGTRRLFASAEVERFSTGVPKWS